MLSQHIWWFLYGVTTLLWVTLILLEAMRQNSACSSPLKICSMWHTWSLIRIWVHVIHSTLAFPCRLCDIQTLTQSYAYTQAQNRPKLHVVDPLDYEGELSSRRKDLEKEPFLNLLLFPQQDVSVSFIRKDVVKLVSSDTNVIGAWVCMRVEKKSRRKKSYTPRPGIEPGSSAWQAEILTTILPRNCWMWCIWNEWWLLLMLF